MLSSEFELGELALGLEGLLLELELLLVEAEDELLALVGIGNGLLWLRLEFELRGVAARA
ncbi:hypothetical protein FACS189449_03390 [Alphaproteobacteria bacterium]|nr:hypothetical protein FACS189449_03390 [Alphaproteobacteria bacterium]